MEFLGILFFVALFVLFIVSFWLKNNLKILNFTHASDEKIVGEGAKKALIIYQPSKNNVATNLTKVIADCLAQYGYTVTINYPSDELNYILSEYDLLIFGSAVYIGRFSPILGSYMLKNRFKNKKVIVYTVAPNVNEVTDLNDLKVLVDSLNEVHAIKIYKGQDERLKKFVKEIISNE